MSLILLNSIFRGLDKCVICRCLLDRSFPKDFPDEWKFCCGCLEWAKIVINPTLNVKILRTIGIFKKVEKYITLVG